MILTDFAQIGSLSAYVSYVRDVLIIFFRAHPYLLFPHAVLSNQTFGLVSRVFHTCIHLFILRFIVGQSFNGVCSMEGLLRG